MGKKIESRKGRSTKNGHEKDVRDNRLRVIGWSLDAMHQTENKSLSVLGFYLAICGVFFETFFACDSIKAIVTSLIVSALGIVAFCIMRKFRLWKRHYLDIVQELLLRSEFRANELPTSLRRYKQTQMGLGYSVDAITMWMPLVIAAISLIAMVLRLAMPCLGK